MAEDKDSNEGKVACTCMQRLLTSPLGEQQRAWVVTAADGPNGETSQVIFSGWDAAQRAVNYARANYFPCHFGMTAEPGAFNKSGRPTELHHGVQGGH